MKTGLIKFFAICTAALTLGMVSCDRDGIDYGKDKDQKGIGTLSFLNFSVETSTDIDIVSRTTTPAPANYLIRIFDSAGMQVGSDYEYGTMPESIVLKAGTYTLRIQSQPTIPAAEFEAPVYGAEKTFTIVEDQTTDLGQIVCKLINIKVSVAYNEAMEAVMGDDCNVRVEIGDGALNFGKTESQCGYFAAPEVSNAMTVKFTGTVDGQYASMTRAFTDVRAGQWRKIKFIMSVNEEGNATFDVVVEDWCDEKELGADINHNEEVLGPDPDKPTNPENPDAPQVIYKGGPVPTTPIVVSAGMELVLKISAPKLIAAFSVDIASDNPDFVNDVLSTGVSPLDLLNPTDAQIQVCGLFGLPYGDAVRDKANVDFVLTDAIGPLAGFPGTHTFTLTITDKEGNKSVTPVKMKVNE